MLCNNFLHIIRSLDILFLHFKILAMRSCPFRKYRKCMLKETSIRCRKFAEDPQKLRGRGSVLIQGFGQMSNVGIWKFEAPPNPLFTCIYARGCASKVILLHRKSSIYSYLTSELTNSIPTCFAEARAVFAEAMLQKKAKRWYCGSSLKQFYRGSIRGSCGCDRGSSAEALADLRFATSRFCSFFSPGPFCVCPPSHRRPRRLGPGGSSQLASARTLVKGMYTAHLLFANDGCK